ncbi:MAG: AbrB/MazE/SpoVT family DNA-binding domain-containing protein [Spirochaetaceae bacterium]
MNTKLIRIGNSRGVRIPREILELYELSEGDDIEISRRRNGILLCPVSKEDSRVTYAASFREMAEEAAEAAEWGSWDGVAGDGLED